MRNEKFVVGDYVHVYNRGNRKMAIVNDEADCWHFLDILRYFNNEECSAKAIRKLFYLKKNDECGLFEWPGKWQAQKPLVKIVSFCLMPNHYHLLLQEIRTGGISAFMQKMGVGFTNYVNSKYEESGRIFQGPYKAKLIGSEEYLQYVDAYIQVLNHFELFDGGIVAAMKNFDKAFQFALDYQFCSLGESFGIRNFSIIDRGEMKNKFPNIGVYKKFAYDALLNRREDDLLSSALIDNA
jgi:putative transposase